MSKRTAQEMSTVKEEASSSLQEHKKKKKRGTDGRTIIKPFTTEQDNTLVKAMMNYHTMNAISYQHNACFRSVKSLMAALLNCAESQIPFTSPQLALRWRVLVLQGSGFNTREESIEAQILEHSNVFWDDKKIELLRIAIAEETRRAGKINWKHIAAKVSSTGLADFECFKKYMQLRYAQMKQESESKLEAARKGLWTPEEDASLVQAVGQCGGGPGHEGFSWAAVALLVEGRHAAACRSRWQSYLQPVALGQKSPRSQKGKSEEWSRHETQFLLEIVRRSDNLSAGGAVNWLKVSEFFCGRRSISECKRHFRKVQQYGI